MTSPPDARPIVVGIDPDPSNRLALAWAADEADRRRLPLRLVHTRQAPPAKYRTAELTAAWDTWDEALRTLGTRALEQTELAEGGTGPVRPMCGAKLSLRRAARGGVTTRWSTSDCANGCGSSLEPKSGWKHVDTRRVRRPFV